MPPQGPPDPGLFVSVRAFWRVLVASLHTRLDLLTTELQEEAVRVAFLVGAAIVGVLALHGALFFALLWILAAVWDTAYRPWVIGAIFLIYAGVGIGMLLYAKSLLSGRPRFLNQTLTELKRDVEGLQMAIKPKEEQP
jgi:uncharacterized membrane protein YqjE